MREPLILASLSPTRARILQEWGIAFSQMDSGFDEESLEISDPAKFAYIACMKKLESTLALLDKRGKLTSALDSGVLCADSVVSVNGKLLRKARDKQEARNMLELQDSKHIKYPNSPSLPKQTRELCGSKRVCLGAREI